MGRRTGLLFALCTLGVLTMLWVLLNDPTSSREASSTLTDHGNASPLSDAIPNASEQTLVQPSALDAPQATAPEVSSAQVSDGPPLAEVVIAAISGRVIDPDGLPLFGARITYVPWVRHESLFEGTEQRPYDLSKLPNTVSDATGHFALEVPWTGDHELGGWPNGTDLILEHPRFATTAVTCRDLSSGSRDVGDVRMEHGAWFSGRVVNEQGLALAGVDVASRVRAPKLPDNRVPYRGALEMALHRITDASGRFRTPGMQTGSLVVEIDHSGYTRLQLVSVDGNHMLYATPGSEQDLGDIVLKRGLTVSGTVTDESGAPVPDAHVVVSPRDQAEAFEDFAHPDTLPWEFESALEDNAGADGRSDAAGYFSIGGLAEGSVAVYARAPELLIGKRSALAAGTDQAHVVLPAGGIYELELLDSVSGAALSGVTFEMYRETFNHSWEYQLPITELSPGLLQASRAGPGDHGVFLRAEGYATVSGRLRGLTSGERRHVTLHLPPEAVLSGRMLDENGTPLEGIQVYVIGDSQGHGPHGDEPLADDDTTAELFTNEVESVSDASGRFRLGTLGPDLIELSFSAQDRVRSNFIHRLQLEVGEHRDLGDVVLALAGSVEIFAHYANGTPVLGRQMTLHAERGRAGDSTDSDGIALITRMAAGVYTLTAEGAGPLDVIVRAGEVTHVDLLLSEPPRVFGHVTRGAEPQVGVKIFVHEDREKSIWGYTRTKRTTHTDADGDYELALPSAGAFHVSVSSASATQLRVLHDFAWDEQRRVDFAFGNARLRGVIHAADDGRALDRIGFELRPLAADSQLMRAVARSDSNGRWQFDELEPGSYMLRAWDPAFAWLSAGPFSTEQDTEIELILQPGSILHGSLTRPGVEMVPDETQLRLVSLSGVQLEDDLDLAWSEAGKYRFRRLPAGRYRVFVGKADEPLTEALVELVAGGTHRLNLVLPP